MITTINHITLAVTNVENSFHFYTAVLELTPAANWKEGAYLTVGGIWLVLVQDDTIGHARHPDYSHIAFDCRPSDFQVLKKRLKVSVIIPACNEADHLEAALLSHQQTRYPDIEYILVNDRSTDNTGRIIDRLAAEDDRLQALHITALPDGWLGKVHAMYQGEKQAGGDWLLFADADIHLSSNALTLAIVFCEANRKDFLTVIPRFLPTGKVFLDAAANLSIYCIFAGGRVWLVDDPDARQVAGFGAFLLVRREVWEQTHGLPWLRLEIADDLGIGLLMKQAGAACSLVNAREEVSLTFYNSFGELKRSHEKGGFAIIGRFSLSRMVAFAVLALFFDFVPFLGFLPAGIAWLPLLGVTGIVLRLATLWAFMYPIRRPLLTALLFPVGSVMNNLLLLRSGVMGRRNGGIRWRNTFYSTDILRQGQRVKFP